MIAKGWQLVSGGGRRSHDADRRWLGQRTIEISAGESDLMISMTDLWSKTHTCPSSRSALPSSGKSGCLPVRPAIVLAGQLFVNLGRDSLLTSTRL